MDRPCTATSKACYSCSRSSAASSPSTRCSACSTRCDASTPIASAGLQLTRGKAGGTAHLAPMHLLPRQPRPLRKRQEAPRALQGLAVPFAALHKDVKLEPAARRFVLASMTSLVAMSSRTRLDWQRSSGRFRIGRPSTTQTTRRCSPRSSATRHNHQIARLEQQHAVPHHPSRRIRPQPLRRPCRAL